MSDEKGRATMFDDWDLKPKERARQLQDKVAMQFVCGECGEGTKSDEDGCCASCGLTIVVAPAEGTSPPGAPAGLRPARDVAHAFESGYEDCPGQLPQSNGHSHSCDRLTAIIEADRASRPGAPMLDPGTVEECAKELEKLGAVPGWYAAQRIREAFAVPAGCAVCGDTGRELRGAPPCCQQCIDKMEPAPGPCLTCVKYIKPRWDCPGCGGTGRARPSLAALSAPPTEGSDSHGK